MFSVDSQEIQDANTGVHVAFGDHGNNTCWMRVTARVPSADGAEVVEKISTVFFQKDGDVLRIVPHDMTSVDDHKAAQAATAEIATSRKEADLASTAHALFDEDGDEELATKKKRR